MIPAVSSLHPVFDIYDEETRIRECYKLIEDYQDLFSSESTDEELVEPVKPQEILNISKKPKSSSSVSSTHSSQSSTGSRSSSSASSRHSILIEKKPPRAWSLNVLNTNDLSKSFYNSGN